VYRFHLVPLPHYSQITFAIFALILQIKQLELVSKAVHVITHATSEITIREYLNPLQLDDSKLAKLNKLRTMAEMPVIIL